METPQEPTPQSPQEPKEEKLEFLKREEVRTMAKDLAMVRDEEARKEQERIARLKQEPAPARPKVVLTQHPEAKPQVPERAPQPPQPKEGSVQPQQPLVKRRSLSRSEKLFTRVVVGAVLLFLAFNAAAFGFWYFFQRKSEPQQKSDRSQLLSTSSPQTEQEPTQEEPAPAPELAPAPAPTPVSFFNTPQQELLLGNSKELMPELQALLAKPPPLGFLNIVVKTQLGILTPEEFLEKSKIAMPPALTEKLTENLMLFSYVANSKRRLGMVFELKDAEGVAEQLRSWEQTMEQNTQAFFDIMGRKGSAYTPFFRSSAYQGVSVRFQTFSVIDFGIVYGILDNKLVLTSSFESFQRTVEQLQTP